MTRYEKGDRNPKDERLTKIANILSVSFNSIKKIYKGYTIGNSNKWK